MCIYQWIPLGPMVLVWAFVQSQILKWQSVNIYTGFAKINCKHDNLEEQQESQLFEVKPCLSLLYNK